MSKLKSNDEVIIINGKDKGVRGTISRIFSNGKCLVKGANLVKKHQKPNPNQGIQGGVIEKEAPIDLSNVAIWNASANKADSVRFDVRDGKKIRIFKSDKTPVGAN